MRYSKAPVVLRSSCLYCGQGILLSYFIKKTMNPTSKIAVLGGGGRTGHFLINRLLDQGYACKVLLRQPDNFTIKSPFLEIQKGDATDPEAILSLCDGCVAVINTLSQRQGEALVASRATRNVLQAMTILGIKQYLLLAGINIDTPSDQKSEATLKATAWMKANYPEIQEDRQEAYRLLSDSDVDWTMVRVPFIEFKEAKGTIVVQEEDCPGNTISAGDIAAFLVALLQDNKYVRKAPFIANV